MARYRLYEGVPGYLVADPETLAVRHIGMRRDPAKEGEPEHVDRFSPYCQVRLVTHESEAAVASGTLLAHGAAVVASSHEEASKKILEALSAAGAGDL